MNVIPGIGIVDDFESGDLSGWNGVDSAATAQQGTVFEGDWALEASPGIGIDSGPGDGLDNYPQRGEVWKIWYNTTTTGRMYIEFFREDELNWYGLLMDPGSDVELRLADGSSLNSINTCPNDGNWYSFTVDWETGSPGNYTITLEDEGGSEIGSMSGSHNDHDGQVIFFLDIDMEGDIFIDYWHLP